MKKRISPFLASIAVLGAVAFGIAVHLVSADMPVASLHEEMLSLGVFLFFSLSILVEINYVLLPHGRIISGGLGIILAAMLVFNTVIAVIIAVAGTVITGGVLKNRPKEPVFFLAAQYALVYSLGGIAMMLLHPLIIGITGEAFIQMLLAGAVVTGVYLVFHIPLNNAYISLLSKIHEKTGWVEEELRRQTGYRYEILCALFLYPIAVTMAYSYEAAHQIPFIPVILGILCILFVRYIGQKQLQKKLWGQANRDELLGVYNRRYMLARLTDEVRMAQLYERPLSIMLIDIDRFKEVNDSNGHLTGDHVLRFVTDVVATSIRGSDTLARFGGDELLVIMHETPIEGAIVIASRIRRRVAEYVFTGKNDRCFSITVSVGVSSLPDDPGKRATETPLGLIVSADEALYAAKKEGRNQVRPSPGQ